MSRVDVGVMGGPRVCTNNALIHDSYAWSGAPDLGREGVNRYIFMYTPQNEGGGVRKTSANEVSAFLRIEDFS